MATKTIKEGRNARLDVRMPPQTRNLVERAADLEGMTLTQFAETAMIQRAGTVIASHEKTLLSRRDQERFLALLEDSPEPTEALTEAVDQYLEMGFGSTIASGGD